MDAKTQATIRNLNFHLAAKEHVEKVAAKSRLSHTDKYSGHALNSDPFLYDRAMLRLRTGVMSTDEVASGDYAI